MGDEGVVGEAEALIEEAEAEAEALEEVVAEAKSVNEEDEADVVIEAVAEAESRAVEEAVAQAEAVEASLTSSHQSSEAPDTQYSPSQPVVRLDTMRVTE